MTGDLLCNWGSIERAKVSNFGGFISWKRLKYGTAGDLFY